jgi:hypothetical protein
VIQVPSTASDHSLAFEVDPDGSIYQYGQNVAEIQNLEVNSAETEETGLEYVVDIGKKLSTSQHGVSSPCLSKEDYSNDLSRDESNTSRVSTEVANSPNELSEASELRDPTKKANTNHEESRSSEYLSGPSDPESLLDIRTEEDDTQSLSAAYSNDISSTIHTPSKSRGVGVNEDMDEDTPLETILSSRESFGDEAAASLELAKTSSGSSTVVDTYEVDVNGSVYGPSDSRIVIHQAPLESESESDSEVEPTSIIEESRSKKDESKAISLSKALSYIFARSRNRFFRKSSTKQIEDSFIASSEHEMALLSPKTVPRSTSSVDVMESDAASFEPEETVQMDTFFPDTSIEERNHLEAFDYGDDYRFSVDGESEDFGGAPDFVLQLSTIYEENDIDSAVASSTSIIPVDGESFDAGRREDQDKWFHTFSGDRRCESKETSSGPVCTLHTISLEEKAMPDMIDHDKSVEPLIEQLDSEHLYEDVSINNLSVSSSQRGEKDEIAYSSIAYGMSGKRRLGKMLGKISRSLIRTPRKSRKPSSIPLSPAPTSDSHSAFVTEDTGVDIANTSQNDDDRVDTGDGSDVDPSQYATSKVFFLDDFLLSGSDASIPEVQNAVTPAASRSSLMTLDHDDIELVAEDGVCIESANEHMMLKADLEDGSVRTTESTIRSSISLHTSLNSSSIPVSSVVPETPAVAVPTDSGDQCVNTLIVDGKQSTLDEHESVELNAQVECSASDLPGMVFDVPTDQEVRESQNSECNNVEVFAEDGGVCIETSGQHTRLEDSDKNDKRRLGKMLGKVSRSLMRSPRKSRKASSIPLSLTPTLDSHSAFVTEDTGLDISTTTQNDDNCVVIGDGSDVDPSRYATTRVFFLDDFLLSRSDASIPEVQNTLSNNDAVFFPISSEPTVEEPGHLFLAPKAASESFDYIDASDSNQLYTEKASHNTPREIISGKVVSQCSTGSDRNENSACGPSELRGTPSPALFQIGAKWGIILPPHLQTKGYDCAATAMNDTWQRESNASSRDSMSLQFKDFEEESLSVKSVPADESKSCSSGVETNVAASTDQSSSEKSTKSFSKRFAKGARFDLAFSRFSKKRANKPLPVDLVEPEAVAEAPSKMVGRSVDNKTDEGLVMLESPCASPLFAENEVKRTTVAIETGNVGGMPFMVGRGEVERSAAAFEIDKPKQGGSVLLLEKSYSSTHLSDEDVDVISTASEGKNLRSFLDTKEIREPEGNADGQFEKPIASTQSLDDVLDNSVPFDQNIAPVLSFDDPLPKHSSPKDDTVQTEHSVTPANNEEVRLEPGQGGIASLGSALLFRFRSPRKSRPSQSLSTVKEANSLVFKSPINKSVDEPVEYTRSLELPSNEPPAIPECSSSDSRLAGNSTKPKYIPNACEAGEDTVEANVTNTDGTARVPSEKARNKVGVSRNKTKRRKPLEIDRPEIKDSGKSGRRVNSECVTPSRKTRRSARAFSKQNFFQTRNTKKHRLASVKIQKKIESVVDQTTQPEGALVVDMSTKPSEEKQDNTRASLDKRGGVNDTMVGFDHLKRTSEINDARITTHDVSNEEKKKHRSASLQIQKKIESVVDRTTQPEGAGVVDTSAKPSEKKQDHTRGSLDKRGVNDTMVDFNDLKRTSEINDATITTHDVSNEENEGSGQAQHSVLISSSKLQIETCHVLDKSTGMNTVEISADTAASIARESPVELSKKDKRASKPVLLYSLPKSPKPEPKKDKMWFSLNVPRGIMKGTEDKCVTRAEAPTYSSKSTKARTSREAKASRSKNTDTSRQPLLSTSPSHRRETSGQRSKQMSASAVLKETDPSKQSSQTLLFHKIETNSQPVTKEVPIKALSSPSPKREEKQRAMKVVKRSTLPPASPTPKQRTGRDPHKTNSTRQVHSSGQKALQDKTSQVKTVSKSHSTTTDPRNKSSKKRARSSDVKNAHVERKESKDATSSLPRTRRHICQRIVVVDESKPKNGQVLEERPGNGAEREEGLTRSAASQQTENQVEGEKRPEQSKSRVILQKKRQTSSAASKQPEKEVHGKKRPEQNKSKVTLQEKRQTSSAASEQPEKRVDEKKRPEQNKSKVTLQEKRQTSIAASEQPEKRVDEKKRPEQHKSEVTLQEKWQTRSAASEQPGKEVDGKKRPEQNKSKVALEEDKDIVQDQEPKKRSKKEERPRSSERRRSRTDSKPLRVKLATYTSEAEKVNSGTKGKHKSISITKISTHRKNMKSEKANEKHLSQDIDGSQTSLKRKAPEKEVSSSNQMHGEKSHQPDKADDRGGKGITGMKTPPSRIKKQKSKESSARRRRLRPKRMRRKVSSRVVITAEQNVDDDSLDDDFWS